MDLKLCVKIKDVKNLSLIQTIFKDYTFILDKDNQLIISDQDAKYKDKNHMKIFVENYFIHALKNYIPNIISYEINSSPSKSKNLKDISIYSHISFKNTVDLLNLQEYNKTLFTFLMKRIISFDLKSNMFIIDKVSYKNLTLFNRFFVKKNTKMINFKNIINKYIGINEFINS